MSKEAAMALVTAEAAPVAPTPTTPTPTPPIMAVDSDRFAKLAAREAKFVKDREMFKSDQQKVYEEKEKLKAVHAQITEFETLKAKDPISALKKIGFTEADIFNFMASKEELTPEQMAEAKASELVKAEIKALRDEQAEKEAKAISDRDDRYIQSFKDGIGQTISKEVEKYEYCSFKGAEAEGIVYETILEIIKLEPEILPHKAMQEALELTEKYYENEDVEMGKLKKRQPKVQVAFEAKAPPARSRVAQAPPSRPAPTLTPKATATAASVAPKGETQAQKRTRLEDWLRNGKPN